MNVREIRALPVPDLATDDACLYLWTTNRYLPDAFRIAAAWDFDSAKALVWCKAPKAPFLGGAFGGASVEFCLYAKRPRHREIGRAGRQWFQWPRGEHSAKPEAFLDIVEQVSPGPYLEMFARRARFGWDYWGDQSLGTAELVA
jgi:N6-adenosine-specific RNA methylase IME4